MSVCQQLCSITSLENSSVCSLTNGTIHFTLKLNLIILTNTKCKRLYIPGSALLKECVYKTYKNNSFLTSTWFLVRSLQRLIRQSTISLTTSKMSDSKSICTTIMINIFSDILLMKSKPRGVFKYRRGLQRHLIYGVSTTAKF